MNEPSSKLLSSLFAEQRVYGVSELNERIRDVLELEFFAVHVQGEVSNYKRHTSGHWYFTLKDAAAQVRAAMFRSRAQWLDWVPAAGDHVIARAIVTLASSLGMRTVAEGVETAAQWQALEALACDEMQGYLFSPPVEAAEITARLLRPALTPEPTLST